MKFENIKSDGLKHEYKVVLSSDDVEQHIVSAITERAKTFKMHGFRPGHVPLNIVRNSVEVHVLKDVFEGLISDACEAIIKSIGSVDLALRPTYKFENNYEKGKDVELTVNIEIAPSFDLKPFKMSLKKIVPVVTEKELEEVREKILKSHPIFEKAEDGYAAQLGDEVFYRASCFSGGVELKKKSFENSLIIPENIPEGAEFMQGFVGKKVRETFDFTPATEKDVVYKFTIKTIKKANKDITWDEYATKRGFKDVSELDNLLKSGIDGDINESAFIYHKHQILEHLSKEYKFDLPKTVVEQETKSVIASIRRELEQEKQKGVADEKDLKKTDEDFAAEYADVINKRVLLGYILNKMAKKYDIKASDDDVKAAILDEAHKSPQYAERIIAHYTSNQNAVAYKRAEIVERKVVEFLITQCDAVEENKTKAEITKLVDDILESEQV